MTSLRTIGEVLTARVSALKAYYDWFALDIDIPILANAMKLASDDERQRIVELAAGCLHTVDEVVYPQLLAIRRLYCYLMRARMLPELLEVLKFWRRGDGAEARVIRHGTRRNPSWHFQYPFFRDPARGLSAAVYDAAAEMTLNARVDGVTWRGGKLRIEGHAYIRQLDARTVRDTRIQVTLHNSSTHRTIRLPVQRVHRPDVTARSGLAGAWHHRVRLAVGGSPHRHATAPRGMPAAD